RRISPLTERRLRSFRANGRGFWSLWIFLFFFVLSLFAELIANDNPLLVRYEGEFYYPAFVTYPETAFGGFFETEAEYREAEVQELIASKGGWMLWAPLHYSHNTVNLRLDRPAPSPPTA